MGIFNKILELIALSLFAFAGLVACNKLISNASAEEVKGYYQELKCPEKATGWTKCKIIHHNVPQKPKKKNYFYIKNNGKIYTRNRL